MIKSGAGEKLKKSYRRNRKSSNEKFVDQEKFAQILILKSSAVIEKFHLILKASPLLGKSGVGKSKKSPDLLKKPHRSQP